MLQVLLKTFSPVARFVGIATLGVAATASFLPPYAENIASDTMAINREFFMVVVIIFIQATFLPCRIG
jgi:hypothetical protein